MINSAIEILKTTWNFVATNHEVLVNVVGLIGAIGGGIWAAIQWGIPWGQRFVGRNAPKRLAEDTFPFEVIEPNSQENVEQKILRSEQSPDNPLADFNIPYVPRQRDSDTQKELEEHLRRNRWLLILGRTGLGKTRETAKLVKRLNNEDWTVLQLQNYEWVQVPSRFPAEHLGTKPQLLFVLDDLNKAIHNSQHQASTEIDTDKRVAFRQPLQERLLQLLKYYEEHCGSERVWVIATARNEPTPDGDHPSQLERLQLETYPAFWQRFYHYELSDAEPYAIAEILKDRTVEANIQSKSEDFETIAHRNDGTFGNVVANLVRFRNPERHLVLSAETYQETLGGTYYERYRAVVKQYPNAKYVYDAVDLLRQVQVELRHEAVLATAQILSNDRGLRRWRQGRQLKRLIETLEKSERILNPRDGQIEAKGQTVDAVQFITPLRHQLLKLADDSPSEMLASLVLFGIASTVTFAHHEDAVAVLEKASRIAPQLDIIWFFKGNALYELGRYQDAIHAFDLALSFKPDLHEALNNKGLALYELGRKEDAIHAYDLALAIKSDFHEALYNKGLALYELGRKEDAIHAYDLALAINPDLHQALNNKGLALYELGRKEDAIHAYDLALAINPDYHQALNNKGNALYELGRYGEAIAAYDLALAIKPDFHEALNNKGNALYELGRKEDAIHAYDLALAINPDYHQALYNKGNALYELGRKEDAIHAFDLALAINPDLHQALNNKGFALYELGRKEDAIHAFDQALAIKSDLHQALNNKGLALYELGRYDEAIAAYDLALAIKPDFHEALNNKGTALYELGRKEDAIHAFDLALAINPDLHQALTNKGLALYELGRKEDAIHAFDLAIAINPDDHQALYNKGYALYELGRKEDAIHAFDLAIAINPDDHQALYIKACCYALQNDVTQALAYLEQAIQLNPEWKEYAKTDSDFDGIRDSAEWQTFFAA